MSVTIDHSIVFNLVSLVTFFIRYRDTLSFLRTALTTILILKNKACFPLAVFRKTTGECIQRTIHLSVSSDLSNSMRKCSNSFSDVSYLATNRTNDYTVHVFIL